MGNQLSRTACRTIIDPSLPPNKRNDRWFPVPDYEELYEVTQAGVVRSIRTGRVLAYHTGAYGHLTVRLTKNGVRKHEHISRILLKVFVGPPPEDKPYALHRDDVPWNNDLSNLRWGSLSENTLDAVRNKTHVQSRKTHCPRGHPYDDANTMRTKDGWRRCKGCLPMHNKLARQRRKERENG